MNDKMAKSLGRSFGRALSQTILVAILPPGDSNEDRAIAAMDKGWENFASLLNSTLGGNNG